MKKDLPRIQINILSNKEAEVTYVFQGATEHENAETAVTVVVTPVPDIFALHERAKVAVLAALKVAIKDLEEG
jgi:hypothetical protein